MTYYLDDQPGIRSWDELVPMAPWTGVYDESRRVLLLRANFLVFVREPPRAWRARHRRGMHRLGFRRTQGDSTCWEWAPPEDAVLQEAGMQPSARGFEVFLARERLLDDQCVVVLRDVFGLTPPDLRLAVPVDDEDEEWDEAL